MSLNFHQCLPQRRDRIFGWSPPHSTTPGLLTHSPHLLGLGVKRLAHRDQVAVNVRLPKLVLNDRDAPAMLFGEDLVEQRGLS